MTVTYEFFGRANQDNHAAAEAVCDAMYECDTDSVTSEVLNRAAEQLADGWDSDSVAACIDGCSFSEVGQ